MVEKIINPVTNNTLIGTVNDIIDNLNIYTFGTWTYNSKECTVTITNDTIPYSYDSENEALVYGKSYYKNQTIIIME